MGHKYHSDTQPRIESITYTPGIQESGDLESATKNIIALTEPGSPDYSTTMLVPTPDDDRLQVLRLAVRLQVTVDSWMGGGTILNYRIQRNGISVGTGTLTNTGATGDLIIAHDITEPAGNLTGPSSYDIYLWVDTGDCVISGVKAWGGVGTNIVNPGNPFISCILLVFSGFCSPSACLQHVGIGIPWAGFYNVGHGINESQNIGRQKIWNGNYSMIEYGSMSVVLNPVIGCSGTVLTDINCIRDCDFVVWT